MPQPEDYTVGWICALVTEYVAAQAFLDDKHEGPDFVPQADFNDYTLGRIGRHNVVIAVFPNGEYGKARAASVASNMMHTFPNVRIGLMVGIGGGAPSDKHDIRLGDIVVSTSRDGHTGVLQYDFGKTIQDKAFQRTGIMNHAPPFLRAAVNGLKAKYELEGHKLQDNVNRILRENLRLQRKYGRPAEQHDRLYKPSVSHQRDDNLDCCTKCGDNQSDLIFRSKRTQYDDDPTIHYGIVASGDQLMKNALIRDILAAEEDILCFEMEAAGLMNHFPCLVIRGICDYSDSHKNKQWQGYAALVAAAYTKDLLYRVPPKKIEAEKTVGEILHNLNRVVEEHLEIQKVEAQRRLTKEEEECHQLFRFTSSGRDTTYEWYKDRVEHTCMWFLEHARFQAWLNQESGPLLVSADPGCGKSVLAKYLIDHGLPRSTTICYFFFKDQDQDTVRQALCALLHQLFSQIPSLLKYAIDAQRRDGDGLIHSTSSLWEIVRNAVADGQAGSVTFVLDALDECAEDEFKNLIENVKGQFRASTSGPGKLKYLMTCRPYRQVLSKFHSLLDAFPNVHIPGEDESEKISQEVNHVIKYRVNQLQMNDDLKSYLEESLKEITHRTYLWVYLVFDYLEKGDFKKTLKGLRSKIKTLPRTVNEAYDRILNKAQDDQVVRRILSIILAAGRPLTLGEMNIAANIHYRLKKLTHLDKENDDDFGQTLRSQCGLFVSIYRGSIYLLHQTAREFLLVDLALPTGIPSELRWYQSITLQEAHATLAEICVLFLSCFESDRKLAASNRRAAAKFKRLLDEHVLFAFRKYSASHWGTHFRQASFEEEAAIVPFAVKIFEVGWERNFLWTDLADFDQIMGDDKLSHLDSLMIVSYYGLRVLAKAFLDRGADIEAKDRKYGRTPLSWATASGDGATVKLLLDQGADIEATDKVVRRTPLSWAIFKGEEEVIRLLLERGAKIEARDFGDQTPLCWAAERGEYDIVKLLLDKGAELETEHRYDRTPQAMATKNGHRDVIELLEQRRKDRNRLT